MHSGQDDSKRNIQTDRQMVQKPYATRQVEYLKKCINCPETVKQLFKSKRNLCEENLNYLFFMFEFNIMTIKKFFLY